MVLTEKPVSQIAATVPINATGIVTAGITVARSDRKNAKITATTITVANPIDFITSLIELSINTPSSEVIKRSTPSGKPARSSSTAARTAFEMSSPIAG